MAYSNSHLNFTQSGVHFNWIDRTDGGVAQGTALFGYNMDYYVDLMLAADVAPYSQSLANGIGPTFREGATQEVPCNFAEGFQTGPSFGPFHGISMAAWILPEPNRMLYTITGSETIRPIVSMLASVCGAGDRSMLFALDNLDRPFIVSSWHGATGRCTSPIPIKMHAWSHVVVSYYDIVDQGNANGVKAKVRMFINGHEVISACKVGYPSEGTGFQQAIVGKLIADSSPYYYPDRYWGEIAQLDVWNRSMTSDMVELLFRFHEPAVLRRKWDLNYVGLPAHHPYRFPRGGVQNLSFSLPFSYNAFDFHPPVYNITQSPAVLQGNWVNGSWVGGTWLNGTLVNATWDKGTFVPDLSINGTMVTHTIFVNHSTLLRNGSWSEPEIVIRASCSSAEACPSLPMDWTFDSYRMWNLSWPDTSFQIFMPRDPNVTHFNLTFELVSGNGTFLNLPKTFTFWAEEYEGDMLPERLFHYDFSESGVVPGLWNFKRSIDGRASGGMLFLDDFNSEVYALSSGPQLGGQLLPPNWNTRQEGWSVAVWMNTTYFYASEATQLLRASYSGTAPYGSRIISESGGWEIRMLDTSVCMYDTGPDRGQKGDGVSFCCPFPAETILRKHQWWMLAFTSEPNGIMKMYLNGEHLCNYWMNQPSWIAGTHSSLRFGGGCVSCYTNEAHIWTMGDIQVWPWALWESEHQMLFQNPPFHLAWKASQFWVAETPPMTLPEGQATTLTFWPGGFFVPNVTSPDWVGLTLHCITDNGPCVAPIVDGQPLPYVLTETHTWNIKPLTGAEGQSVRVEMRTGATFMNITFSLSGDTTRHLPPDPIIIRLTDTDLLVNRVNMNLTTLQPSVSSPHGWTDLTNPLINPSYTHGMQPFISHWQTYVYAGQGQLSLFELNDGFQPPPNSHGLVVTMDRTIPTWNDGFSIVMWVYQYIPQGGRIFTLGSSASVNEDIYFELGTSFYAGMTHSGVGVGSGSLPSGQYRSVLHQWQAVAFSLDKQYQITLMQWAQNKVESSTQGNRAPVRIIERLSSYVMHRHAPSTNIVLSGHNGLLAQVLYYNHSLQPWELESLTNHPPPAITAGRHQLFQYTPCPSIIPSGSTFTTTIRLPHLHGESVTLHAVSNPPGLVQPATHTWIPKNKDVPADFADLELSVEMPNDMSIDNVSLEFWLTGDIQHYASINNCTILNYKMDHDLVLDYSYPLLTREAVFDLNTSASYTPLHAARDPLMPGVILFEGLNDWLDLNDPADTNMTTMIDSTMFNYDVTNGYPHLYTKGWSMTTWIQMHSFGRGHPLLSCGTSTNNADDAITIYIRTYIPSNAPTDNPYRVELVMDNSQSTASPQCILRQGSSSAAVTALIYSWAHVAFTVDSYSIIRAYFNGQLIYTAQCEFPLPLLRSRCYFGTNLGRTKFMTGRLAALQLYDRALVSVEVDALSRTLIRNMWYTPFQFPPWTPPPYLDYMVALPIHLYTPHHDSSAIGANVSVCARTDPPGFIHPSNVTWQAGDRMTRVFTLTLDNVTHAFSVSFELCHNSHPFPLWAVPPNSTVTNLTSKDLYASAPTQLNMNEPSEHGLWEPNLRVAGLGTTVTQPSGSYLNLNDPGDATLNSIVPIDPYFISRGHGMSVAFWLVVQGAPTGYVFDFGRLKITLMDDASLLITTTDTASGYDGGCQIVPICYFGCSYPGKSISNTFVVDEWIGLVFTWDHWEGDVHIWADGQEAKAMSCGTSTIRPWDVFYAASSTSASGGYEGQLANFYIFPRALYQWEAKMLYDEQPLNIIPIKFRYRQVNGTQLPLALGWETHHHLEYQLYITFGTHPALIPRWDCDPAATLPCKLIDQYISPPAGVAYDMTDYFSSWHAGKPPSWLTFDLSPGPFANFPESGTAPTITLSFQLMNDTFHFIKPQAVKFSIPILRDSSRFLLHTETKSLHGDWAIAPTLFPNTGVARLVNNATDPAPYYYLDLYEEQDTLSPLPAPNNVMNSITDLEAGWTMSVWLKLYGNDTLTQPYETRTLLWCGNTMVPYPDWEGIIIRFKGPDRIPVVTVSGTYRIVYVPTPGYPDGMPVKVPTNCICPASTPTPTIPTHRWFQLILVFSRDNVLTLLQSGQTIARCTCDIVPQFFRDTCYLGRDPASMGGQSHLNGSIAAFDVWDRQLLPQEIIALTQSPPQSLWPYPMIFETDMTYQLERLHQNGTLTVTPGLSVWSGLVMTPILTKPIWYDPGPMSLIIYNSSSNGYDTQNLRFPPLSLQNTVVLDISWPANIPYVSIPLNMSNRAHYQYPNNYTIINPLPWRIYNTSYFRLNTSRASASLEWKESYSYVWDVGVAWANYSDPAGEIVPSLNLTNIADTRAESEPNDNFQGAFHSIMPTKLHPSSYPSDGFSFVTWLMFPNESLPSIPRQDDVFIWSPDASSNAHRISLSIHYPSGYLYFRFYDGAGNVACETQSTQPVPWNVWLPVIGTIGLSGNMTLGTGIMWAQYATQFQQCPPTSLYPDTSIDRPVATLGGASGGIEIVTFYYFEYQLSLLEQQILYYAPPAACSPSNWLLRSQLPPFLFLNQPLTLRWKLNSWTTVSGVVTMVPQPTAGYTIPPNVTFTGQEEREYQYVAPNEGQIVRLSAIQVGDTYYHNGVPDIYIECKGGIFILDNVPQSLIPTIPITISIIPNVLPFRHVNLRWNATDGASLSRTNYTWTSESVLEPIYITIRAPATNASWFLIQWSVDKASGDGIYYAAPETLNISLSYISSIERISPVPGWIYSYASSEPIWFKPMTPPPDGINLTINSSLGAGVLSTTEIYFPPGLVAPQPLIISAPYTSVLSTISLHFNVTGNDTDVFLTYPEDFTIQWRPQTWIRAVSIPEVVFATRVFDIELEVHDPPNHPLYTEVAATWEGATAAGAYGFTVANFSRYQTTKYEQNLGITAWDEPHPLYAQVSALAPDVYPFVRLNLSVLNSTTDISHYIFDNVTIPANGVITIPTGPLVYVKSIQAHETVLINGSIQLSFACMRRPYNNESVGNITITPSHGRVHPPFIVFDYNNWQDVMNVTFTAPPNYATVTFTYGVTGHLSEQFVTPKSTDLRVTVLGYFTMSSPAKTLWIGQPSVFSVVPLGYKPGCYLSYWACVDVPASPPCDPADTMFAPEGYLTFTPIVDSSSFILVAPTAAVGSNVTVGFNLVGGPDYDKMIVRDPFSVLLNRTDFWDLKVYGASWTGPDLPSYEGSRKLNWTVWDPLTGLWFNRHGFGYWFDVNTTVSHAVGRITVEATFDTPGSVEAYVITEKYNGTDADGVQQWITAQSDTCVLQNNTSGDVWFDLRGVGRSTLVLHSSADGMTYRYHINRRPADVHDLRLITEPGDFGGFVGAPMSDYMEAWDPYHEELEVIGPISIPYNITHIRVNMNFSELLEPYANGDIYSGWKARDNECSVSWMNELLLANGSTALVPGSSNFHRYSNVRWINGTIRDWSYTDPGPLIPLALNTNIIYVNCSLDGVYRFNISRSLPVVTSLVVNSQSMTTEKFQPEFVKEYPDPYVFVPFHTYNISVAYAMTALNFEPRFRLNNTVGLDYVGATPMGPTAIPIHTQSPNPSVYLPYPLAQLQLEVWQESQLIYYYINVVRRPPSLFNVALTGSTIGVGHVLYEAGYLPVFAEDNEYLSVVPYKTNQICFNVTWNTTDASHTVALHTNDPRNVNNGSAPPQVPPRIEQLTSGVCSGWVNVSVGLNYVYLNDSKDGSYMFTIHRLAPELPTNTSLQLRFVSQTAPSVRDPAPFLADLQPRFQPGQLDLGYTVTLPFHWKDVGLWFDSTMPSIFIMWIPDSNQSVMAVTVQIDSAGSLQLQVPGSVLIYVESPNDGIYQFTVNVMPPDMTDLTFTTRNDHNFINNPPVDTLELNPTGTLWSSPVYSYASTPHWLLTHIALAANFSHNASVSIEFDGAYVQTLLPNAASTWIALPPGASTLRLLSTQDGYYTFSIDRLPDMCGLAIRGKQGASPPLSVIYKPTSACFTLPIAPYVPATSGETVGHSSVIFDSSNYVVNATLPFIYRSMEVLTKSVATLPFLLDYAHAFNMSVDAVLADARAQVPIGNGLVYTVLPPTNWSSTWPLEVGVNVLHLNASLDGGYVFVLDRLHADVHNISAVSHAATAGWIQPLPVNIVDLAPIFVYESLATRYATVPAVVGFVRINTTFLTIGSCSATNTQASTVSLTSDVPSQLLALLPAAMTNITIDSTQDGIYMLTVTRLPFDTINLTLTAYDTAGLRTDATMTMQPPLTEGVYDYTITVPYGSTQLSLHAVSASNHSEYISLQNGGLPFAIIKGNENRASINNTLDGELTFTVQWAPPDLIGVELTTNRAVDGGARPTFIWSPDNIPTANPRPYAGAATGPTMGQAGEQFNSFKRLYEFIVPYVMDEVLFMANATTNATVVFERDQPESGIVIYQYKPYQLQSCPLALGLNRIRLNSTKDGYYQFFFNRVVDMVDIGFNPVPATAGNLPMPTVLLDPTFTPGLFTYHVNVPMSVGAVFINATFQTVGTVNVTDINGQSQPLTSRLFSTADLPLNADADNLITVFSAQDGQYQVIVHRDAAQIRNISLIAIDEVGLETPVSLQPNFTSGIYQYTIVVPWATDYVEGSADAVTGSVNVSHGGLLPVDPHTPDENVMIICSTLDGCITIHVVFAEPWLRGVVLQEEGQQQTLIVHTPTNIGVEQRPYYAPTIGATANETYESWDPYVREYRIELPYISHDVTLYLNYSTSINGSLTVDYPAMNGANKILSPPASPPLIRVPTVSLPLGWSLFRINSTQSGYYKIWVFRASPDILGVSFVSVLDAALIVSDNANAGFTHLFRADNTTDGYANQTYQVFEHGRREYSIIVPFNIINVRTMINISSNAACNLEHQSFFPAPSNSSSVIGVPPVIMTWPVAPGRNIFTLNSTYNGRELDGSYKFTITRIYSDVTDITVIGTSGSAGYSKVPPTPLLPPFHRSVVYYEVHVAYVCASVQTNQTFFTVGSTHMSVADIGLSTSLISNELSPSIPLVAGESRLIAISNLIDGTYVLNVTRANPDTVDIQLTGHDPAGESRPLTLEPPFDGTVQSYIVYVSWAVTSVSSLPFSHSRSNASEVLTTTDGALGYPLPLTPSGGVLITNSSLDGRYVINLVRLPPDVSGIRVFGLNTSEYGLKWQHLPPVWVEYTNVLNPQSSWITNAINPNYSLVLPYAINETAISINFTATPTVTLHLPPSLAAFGSEILLGPNERCQPLPLHVGRNTFIVSSRTSGNLTVVITRGVYVAPPPTPPCLSQPGGLNPCMYGGACVDEASTVYNTTYTCQCADGYSGKNCEITKQPLPPPLSPTPIARLSIPITFSDCDVVIIDGRLSTFSAESRDASRYLTYDFSISAILADSDGHDLITSGEVDRTSLILGVTLGYFPSGSVGAYDVIHVPAQQLMSGVTYIVSLRVGGPSSVSPVKSLPMRKVDGGSTSCVDWLPLLSIQPPARITRPVTNEFEASLESEPNRPPIPHDATFTYHWSIKRQHDGGDVWECAEVGPVTGSEVLKLNGTSLVIPPYFLVAGATYFIELQLDINVPSDSSAVSARRLFGSVGVTVSASAHAHVYVEPSQLVASIDGANRERWEGMTLILDGSGSYDPDFSPNPTDTPPFPIVWTWKCLVVAAPDGVTVNPCPLTEAQEHERTLSFPPFSFQAYIRYQFLLTITSSNATDDRSMSSAVQVSFKPTPSLPTPLVTIDAPTQVNPSAPLRLIALVNTTSGTPLHMLEMTWWSDVTPPLDLSSPNITASPPHTSTLVIRPYILSPGFHTFFLQVCDPATSTCGSANAIVSVNFAPVDGECMVIPTSGWAFETEYYVECRNWRDPQFAEPFEYSFGFVQVNGSTGVVLDPSVFMLTSPSDAPFATVLLPPGNLELRAFITNALGATTVARMNAEAFLRSEAVSDPLDYIRGIANTTLEVTLAAGQVDRAVSLISELADYLNMQPNSNHSLVHIRQNLLDALDEIVGGRTLSPGETVLLSQALQRLTNAGGAGALAWLSEDSWAQLHRLTTEAINSVPSSADTSINKEQLVDNIANTISNLLFNCSEFDTVNEFMFHLLNAAMNGLAPGEQTPVIETPNINAKVLLSNAQDGVWIQQPNGLMVQLPPEAVNSYAELISNLSTSALDSGNAGVPQLQTRIVAFDNDFADCREGAQGQLGSGMVSIEIDVCTTDNACTSLNFTELNDALENAGLPPAKVTFLQPLSNASYMNQPLDVCPGDPPANISSLLTCSFYDPELGEFSTDGCRSNGLTSDGLSLNCTCAHLTEFALIVQEAERRLQSQCAEAMESAIYWPIFLAIYTTLAIVSITQFTRIYLPFKCAYWLMTYEHALLFAYCIFRALNCALYWKLTPHLSFAVASMITGLPYTVASWIFTFVIFAWAGIIAASSQGIRSRNPFDPYKGRFIALNSLISFVLFGLVLAMAASTNIEHIQRLSDAGSVISGLVNVAFAMAFSLYGRKLVHSLLIDGYVSPYAKKLAAVAASLSLIFASTGALNLYEVFLAAPDAPDTDARRIAYYALDCTGVTIVLLLFVKSVNDAFRAQKIAAGMGASNKIVASDKYLAARRDTLREQQLQQAIEEIQMANMEPPVDEDEEEIEESSVLSSHITEEESSQQAGESEGEDIPPEPNLKHESSKSSTKSPAATTEADSDKTDPVSAEKESEEGEGSEQNSASAPTPTPPPEPRRNLLILDPLPNPPKSAASSPRLLASNKVAPSPRDQPTTESSPPPPPAMAARRFFMQQATAHEQPESDQESESESESESSAEKPSPPKPKRAASVLTQAEKAAQKYPVWIRKLAAVSPATVAAYLPQYGSTRTQDINTNHASGSASASASVSALHRSPTMLNRSPTLQARSRAAALTAAARARFAAAAGSVTATSTNANHSPPMHQRARSLGVSLRRQRSSGSNDEHEHEHEHAAGIRDRPSFPRSSSMFAIPDEREPDSSSPSSSRSSTSPRSHVNASPSISTSVYASVNDVNLASPSASFASPSASFAQARRVRRSSGLSNFNLGPSAFDSDTPAPAASPTLSSAHSPQIKASPSRQFAIAQILPGQIHDHDQHAHSTWDALPEGEHEGEIDEVDEHEHDGEGKGEDENAKLPDERHIITYGEDANSVEDDQHRLETHISDDTKPLHSDEQHIVESANTRPANKNRASASPFGPRPRTAAQLRMNSVVSNTPLDTTDMMIPSHHANMPISLLSSSSVSDASSASSSSSHSRSSSVHHPHHLPLADSRSRPSDPPVPSDPDPDHDPEARPQTSPGPPQLRRARTSQSAVDIPSRRLSRMQLLAQQATIDQASTAAKQRSRPKPKLGFGSSAPIGHGSTNNQGRK